MSCVLGVVQWCLDGLSSKEKKLVKPMSLNYDVGSDSQSRYLPSKYFNPQLITWWVQWAEVWGCGGWGLRGGLPRWPGTFFLSVWCPFFQGDCGKSQTGRPPERATGWREVLRARGKATWEHVAPRATQVLTNPPNRHEQTPVINKIWLHL